MKSITKVLTFFVIIVFSSTVHAGGVNWFTDTPPMMEMMKKLRFAHGGPVEMGRGGLHIKTLWLRSGTNPGDGEPVYHYRSDSAEVLLRYPDGRTKEITPVESGHAYGFRFEMPQEGFYNMYHLDRFVKGGVLHVVVTKAEVLKHSCSKGHDHVQDRMPPRSLDDIPFELVRQRIPGEDFHTNISSGDQLTFNVLYKGRPAVNADVRFISQKGWVKNAKADESGNVTYELIRDYYPPIWSKFKRRKSERSIAAADYTVEEEGIYNGQPYSTVRYITTLPGNYYPSKQEYTSYLYGLALLIFTLAFSAAGVYIHRSRREKPYREERFVEGD